MRTLRKKHRPATLVVDQGRVNCPIANGDVEVERCFVCGYVVDFDVQDAVVAIRCNPEKRLQNAALWP